MDAVYQPKFRWPDDYVAMDDGRMLVRRDCVEGFAELGWNTTADVMNATNVEVIRQLRGRDNCRVTVSSEGGSINGYMKRHRIRTMRRWLLENRRRRASRSPGMSEANAIGWCQQAGVPTVSVIAAGTQPMPRAWQDDSFFISEELQGCTPANDYWFRFDQRLNPPDGFASDVRTRATILRAVADTARKFHEAELSHFDFYLEHFFVTNGPNPRAFLVDLQRVEQHQHAATRWRALNKDLAQFFRSFERYRFSKAERDEWIRCYLNQPGDLTMTHSLRIVLANGRLRMRQFRRLLQKRGKRAA